MEIELICLAETRRISGLHCSNKDIPEVAVCVFIELDTRMSLFSLKHLSILTSINNPTGILFEVFQIITCFKLKTSGLHVLCTQHSQQLKQLKAHQFEAKPIHYQGSIVCISER